MHCKERRLYNKLLRVLWGLELVTFRSKLRSSGLWRRKTLLLPYLSHWKWALRNVGILPQHYTASQSRRPHGLNL